MTESVNDRLEIDPRADHVCSAGGDGTLRHVVDAVRRSGRHVSVSAFPAGTVNLLAVEPTSGKQLRMSVKIAIMSDEQVGKEKAIVSALRMGM